MEHRCRSRFAPSHVTRHDHLILHRLELHSRIMNTKEFFTALSHLKRDAAQRDNFECFELDDSRWCSRSTFCTQCERCHRCNYADACIECSDCTHITRCTQCHRSTHLVDCRHCVESQYLVHCQDCADCTYCFGCVGLVGKEFHILNVPYDRKTYFQKKSELEAMV